MTVRDYEKYIIKIILKSLNLSYLWKYLSQSQGVIKNIDNIVCNSESYYLRGYKIFEDISIIEDPIIPMPPKEAYKYFMENWNEIYN